MNDLYSLTSLSLCRQPSNVSSTHSTRAQRNRLYRSKMRTQRLPQSAREFYRTNPCAFGLPRAFNVLFEKPDEGLERTTPLSSAKITFSRFGNEGHGLKLNGHQIDPHDLSYQPGTSSCTFGSTLVNNETESIPVVGHFDFASSYTSAYGSLDVGEHDYPVTLEPAWVTYNAEVSVNAGAYWDTAAQKLVWDEQSEAWANASWEQSMQFSYRTVTDRDDEDDPEPLTVIENCFTDTLSDPPTRFPLMLKDSGDFHCVFETLGDQITMQTTVDIPELAPSSTSRNSPIKSVFPSVFVARFDWGGMSFTGAYKDKEGNVVAVKGDVAEEDESSLLPSLATTAGRPPAKDINYTLNNVKIPTSSVPRNDVVIISSESSPVNNVGIPISSLPLNDDVVTVSSLSLPQRDVVVPIRAPSANPPIRLMVAALLGNDTMVRDDKDPTGYADSISKLAMQDFHDIIVFYMDKQLRDTFVGRNPALAPEIKAIALSGGDETAKFYQSLQVPYLTAMLANSTVDEAKRCNGVRAERLLKEIPAESKVYKAQSAALYRFRYLEKFPDTLEFIRDQRDKDYSADIDRITESMKRNLRESTRGIEASNPNGSEHFEASVRNAETDIDKLGQWAKQENLYWAFRLLYKIQRSQLPQWYAMYMSGTLNSKLGMRIKQLNGLFEILEDNKINRDGMSFAEAYNDMIRAFQMRSIIPQMVDLDGCYSDFDSVLKESLNQFWLHYKDSKDPNLAEQANTSKQLYTNEELRKNFLTSLRASSRLSSASSSWELIVQMWQETVRTSTWFKAARKFNEKALTHLKVFAAVALLIMPVLPGLWSAMSAADKTMWGVSAAGIAATFIIKAGVNTYRYAFFFKEISGWGDTLKTIFGFESVIDKIPEAAQRIGSSAGRYFLSTARTNAILAEEQAALPFGGVQYYSRFSRMFGRSFSELLGTVAGFTLAAVCLVMTSISLAKETDPLLIAMDVLMVLSSALQILAIVAGWVIGWGVTTALGTMTLVATWGGPVGIILAVIGIIILIVWACTHKEETPVENFVNDYMRPAGLYMKFKAIDYMEGLAATGTTASRYGVSIRSGRNESAYLSLDAPQTSSGSVKVTNLLDFTSDTVWALRTDGRGRSQIYTQKAYQDSVGGTFRHVWYLSATDDEDGVCARRLPNKSDDVGKYKESQKLTHWVVTVVAKPDEDPNTKAPVRALCSVYYKTRDETRTLTLKMDAGKQLKLSTEFNLLAPDTWLFEMQSLGPLPFHYNKTPWTIHTSHRNEKNRAIFNEPLATSTGYKWSIEPALDDRFLELVTTSGNDEGTIRLKEGAEPQIMSKTSYIVTCTLLVNDTPHGQQQAAVEIEVVGN